MSSTLIDSTPEVKAPTGLLENTTYSIFGNATELQASRTINTESIPSGGAFNIKNNAVNLLGCWQSLTKKDNFYDVLTRVEVNTDFAKSIDESIFIYKFILPGMVRMDKMYLTFLVDLEMTNSNVGSNNKGFLFSSLSQSDYCFIDIIKQVWLKIGSGVFTIGNTELNNTMGIKMNIHSRPFTKFHEIQLKRLGLSYSNSAECALLESPPGIKLVPLRERNDELDNQFFDLTARNLSVTTLESTLTYEICIPLAFLNPFFTNSETYLPKSLPMEIKIELNNNVSIAGATGGFFNIISRNPRKAQIIYEYKALTQQANSEFNNLFSKNPLLYNFLDFKVSKFKCDGLEKNFRSQICRNEPVPIEVILNVETIQLDSKLKFYNGSTNLEFINRPNMSCPFILKYIRISVAGRIILDYSNNNGNPYVIGETSLTPQKYYYNNVAYEQIQTTNIYESTEKWQRKNKSDYMNNIYCGSPFRMILDRESRYNAYSQSIDSGSSNVVVEYEITDQFGNPFSALYQICFYYNMNTQIIVDNRFQIQQISWPAISTGGMNVLQKTVNVN
jgi:hypothetical protein